MSTKKSDTSKKSSFKTVKPTDDLNSLLYQKAALEQKIKEVKEKARKEINIGDYLIITDDNELYGAFQIGQIFEVKQILPEYFEVFCEENKRNSFDPTWTFQKKDNYYRKATGSEIKEYKEKLAEEDLARRFEANKKDLETLKIGDYLVFVPEFANFANLSVVSANTLNKITGFAENGEVKLNGLEVSWIKSRFRRATQQEINEFELKNIKVGDWVYILKPFGQLISGQYFKIKSLNGKCYYGDNLVDAFRIEDYIPIAKNSINNLWRIASVEEVQKYQKEQEEDKNKEFKVDDYVVVLESTDSNDFISGHIYKVKSFYGQNSCGLDVYVDSFNSTTNGWGKQHFRKATSEEVVKYQSKFEYKVEKDDFVTNDKSGFMRVSGESDNSHWFKVGYESYLKSEWRLATPKEIESYLRAEADKKGYKVGVKVKYQGSSSGEIKKINFAGKREEFLSVAYESQKNILFAVWDSNWGTHYAEIYDELEIIKEEIVTVNGYNAEYHMNYIQFGCAKISMNMLRDLSHMMNQNDGYYDNGNRFIEGDIKIGAGTFNKSIIEKLIKIHQEKFSK